MRSYRVNTMLPGLFLNHLLQEGFFSGKSCSAGSAPRPRYFGNNDAVPEVTQEALFFKLIHDSIMQGQGQWLTPCFWYGCCN